jgi:AmmeMemoRadiSam system protein B/AmmeMemoRadiSam system protein A
VRRFARGLCLLAVGVLLLLPACRCQDRIDDDGAGAGRAEAEDRGALPRSVRQPAVAGSWYAGDRADLAAEVDGFLAAADPPEPEGAGRVRALIAPHAGYRYSGATAAYAYEVVKGQEPSRVIVLGPAHGGAVRGLSITRRTHYETPLGEIPIDLAAVETLRRDGLVGAEENAHAREHSIEIQLPFLQRALAPGWKLVPVLVGRLDMDGYARAAELVREVTHGDTLVVVSGDFTHYGPNYGYVPFPADDEVAGRLRALDLGAYELIASRDRAGLAAYRESTGITACGLGPAMVLMGMLPAQATATLLRYETSGDMQGSYRNSVSYLAIAFTSPQALGSASAADATATLSSADMELLHLIARRALLRAVADDPDVIEVEQLVGGRKLPLELVRPSGAFVTLERDGRLRGCVGHIDPVSPLYRAVIENARNAALHDSRFSPVERDELEGLDVEVSVLSPLRPIASPEAFRVGEHGIVMRKHGRRAVYLPEVALEQGWDRELTLASLSRKAGLPPDAWRSDTQLYVFTTQAHHGPWSP